MIIMIIIVSILIITIIIIICANGQSKEWMHTHVDTCQLGMDTLDNINLGWHYLSNATCLIWPRLFHACFVVSRIAVTHYIVRHI